MIPVDVVIPTVDNPQWLTRCCSSLCWNTNIGHVHQVHVLGSREPNEGKFVYIDRPPGSTWLDAMRLAASICTAPLILHVQDDCMILPGNQNWIEWMARPLLERPKVGVVACTVTASGCGTQTVRAGFAPGYYYATNFAPILFLARLEALRDMIEGIPEDLFCDQEVPLNLMEKGWKIVMATNVVQYHEGMQTNLRVYGGADPMAWIKECGRRIKEEVPKRHSAEWCRRLDACEMVPMGPM